MLLGSVGLAVEVLVSFSFSTLLFLDRSDFEAGFSTSKREISAQNLQAPSQHWQTQLTQCHCQSPNQQWPLVYHMSASVDFSYQVLSIIVDLNMSIAGIA